MICSSLWPIFHGPVILYDILKTHNFNNTLLHQLGVYMPHGTFSSLETNMVGKKSQRQVLSGRGLNGSD